MIIIVHCKISSTYQGKRGNMVEFEVKVPWKNGLGNAKAIKIARLTQKYPMVDVCLSISSVKANGHDILQLEKLKAKKGDKISITLKPINGEQQNTVRNMRRELENFFLISLNK